MGLKKGCAAMKCFKQKFRSDSGVRYGREKHNGEAIREHQ